MSKEQIANIGDVLICVDAGQFNGVGLTEGKVYEVLQYERNRYLVQNDYKQDTWYYTNRFEQAKLSVADKEGEPTFGVSEEGHIGINPEELKINFDVTNAEPEELYLRAEAPTQLDDLEIFPSFKVNVLGQDYNVVFKPYDKDVVLNENLGYCDFYSKEIVVRANHPQSLLSNPNEDLIMLHTIRHEITHAFMFESGLDGSSEYARNEELIDWIAIQIPKMVNTMTDAVDKLDKLMGVEDSE